MLTVIFSLIPYIFTVALALGIAVVGFGQYRLVAAVTAEVRMGCVVLIVGVGALLSVALTTRTLDETALAAGVMSTYEDFAGGFAASRWLSLLLVSTSLVEIVRGWVRARADATPDPAWPVLLALLAFSFGTMFVEAVLSDHPELSLRNLYVPVVLLGLYYQRPRSLRPVLVAAKWALLLVTCGSLAAMIVRPDFAIHHPDPSWIPGLNWRLYGLTPHANALGPIALLAIVMELHTPSAPKTVRWLHLAAAAAVFVLAQSKTAWAAAPLIFAAVYLPLALRHRAGAGGATRSFERAVWILLGAIVILIVLTGAVVAFDVLDVLRRRTDLSTLTGRTQIWEITLQAWQENMLFGYGPEIWGAERRQQFQMFHVGHAHNQVVQTLGEAGLVGTTLLLIYLGTLFHAALRRFVASRGIVLMLLVLLVVRCVTEAPLSHEGLLSWDTFLQVLLLTTACYYLRQSPEGAAVVVVPLPAAACGRLARGAAPISHLSACPRMGA